MRTSKHLVRRRYYHCAPKEFAISCRQDTWHFAKKHPAQKSSTAMTINDSSTDEDSQLLSSQKEKPPRISTKHLLLTEQNIGSVPAECESCTDLYLAGHSITTLLCGHRMHEFCMGDRTFNREDKGDKCFVPMCTFCRRRYRSKGILFTDIATQQKLEQCQQKQQSRIWAIIPGDRRRQDLDHDCWPAAFRADTSPKRVAEGRKTHPWVEPCDKNTIWTANDVYHRDMVMVKACVVGVNHTLYIWLAKDCNLREAGTKWQQAIEPWWGGDITEMKPFFELQKPSMKTRESRLNHTSNACKHKICSKGQSCMCLMKDPASFCGQQIAPRPLLLTRPFCFLTSE